jgi:hypothetical protein
MATASRHALDQSIPFWGARKRARALLRELEDLRGEYDDLRKQVAKLGDARREHGARVAKKKYRDRKGVLEMPKNQAVSGQYSTSMRLH